MVNEVNLGELGADTINNRMKELRKQHAEEIHDYKAKILNLKNQVATLKLGETTSSRSLPIAPTNINLLSLPADRYTTL